MKNINRPIIGIVGKLLLNEQLRKTLWKRVVVNDEIKQLIAENGGIAIGIFPYEYKNTLDTSNKLEIISDYEKEYLYEQLKLVDGIILQGGLTSDTYEVEIVKYAIKNNIPIIGICAGFNNIARALNINLKYKPFFDSIHNVYDADYRHIVNINQKHTYYELINQEKINVNSLHSMFFEKCDDTNNIEILATSQDKLDDNDTVEHIEAFTVNNTKFCMAIKWHPELMKEDDSTIKIFKQFVEICKNNNEENNEISN